MLLIIAVLTIRSPRAVLFIMEIDERVFETIDTVNQRWVDKVTKRDEIEGATTSGHGNGEKSDALTSEEIGALLEEHTRQLQERDQHTHQLEQRLQLLEAKNSEKLVIGALEDTGQKVRFVRDDDEDKVEEQGEKTTNNEGMLGTAENNVDKEEDV